MGRSILALLWLMWGASGASAQSLDAPEGFLASCAFASQFNQSWCKSEQERFLEAYRRALNKDYYSQRNVALCLISGCDGAVAIDKRRACAWRLLILSSGSPYIDTSDKSNYRFDCAGLDGKLDRGAIQEMTQTLMLRIYGKASTTP